REPYQLIAVNKDFKPAHIDYVQDNDKPAHQIASPAQCYRYCALTAQNFKSLKTASPFICSSFSTCADTSTANGQMLTCKLSSQLNSSSMNQNSQTELIDK